MGVYRSRRLRLPGGREIEVILLGDLPEAVVDGGGAPIAAGRPQEPPAGPGAELWMCDGCGGDMVRPLALEELSDGRWRVERTCPECGWHHAGA